MTKVLTLETCKRLAEAGVEVETEYLYAKYNLERYKHRTPELREPDDIDINMIILAPAPNLEEAIELLPNKLKYENEKCFIWFGKFEKWYVCQVRSSTNKWRWKGVVWRNPIETYEKMINYLLDNKLLWQKQ